MAISNTLQAVKTYNQDFTLPTLEAALTLTKLTNKKFNNWKTITKQRGQTVEYRKPTLFNVTNSLSFDPVNDGSFAERFAYLTVDQERLTNYAITDEQLATYPLEELANDMGDESMIAMAGNIDSYVAQKACSGGYRWVGDREAKAGTMGSFAALRQAVVAARNFGGSQTLHCVIPDTSIPSIFSSGAQEYIPDRNNDLDKSWRLPQVGGMANTQFYQSQLLPTHTSGTAAGKEVAITNVTESTYTENGETLSASEIVLSGLTSGETIVADDLGDISGATPIRFLRQQDKTPTAINPQFKVITGGTADGSGNLTIKVAPALIFDATNKNPERNLSRAIVPATDKLYIVKSHKRGVIFYQPAFQMACPKLPSKSPYASDVAQTESGIALRSYHGSVFGEPITQMVHDVLFGVSMDRDYAATLIFPLESANFTFA
jgi:hypothetical protein